MRCSGFELRVEEQTLRGHGDGGTDVPHCLQTPVPVASRRGRVVHHRLQVVVGTSQLLHQARVAPSSFVKKMLYVVWDRLTSVDATSERSLLHGGRSTCRIQGT